MARTMWESDKYLFRTVIVTHFDDGSTRTGLAGPFTAKGAATSAIKREQNAVARGYRWWLGPAKATHVTGHVERTAMVWEKVQ